LLLLTEPSSRDHDEISVRDRHGEIRPRNCARQLEALSARCRVDRDPIGPEEGDLTNERRAAWEE
jgi:hypothetical protein